MADGEKQSETRGNGLHGLHTYWLGDYAESSECSNDTNVVALTYECTVAISYNDVDNYYWDHIETPFSNS